MSFKIGGFGPNVYADWCALTIVQRCGYGNRDQLRRHVLLALLKRDNVLVVEKKQSLVPGPAKSEVKRRMSAPQGGKGKSAGRGERLPATRNRQAGGRQRDEGAGRNQSVSSCPNFEGGKTWGGWFAPPIIALGCFRCGFDGSSNSKATTVNFSYSNAAALSGVLANTASMTLKDSGGAAQLPILGTTFVDSRFGTWMFQASSLQTCFSQGKGVGCSTPCSNSHCQAPCEPVTGSSTQSSVRQWQV
jgi:hypothetical protein